MSNRISVEEFIKVSKKLLELGNKTIKTTSIVLDTNETIKIKYNLNSISINSILVALRIRDAYYCDDDREPFTSYPALYQKELLKLCNIAGLSIKFFSNTRWILYNDNVETLKVSSDKLFGKLLGFPCTANAFDLGKQTSQKFGIDFYLRTKKYGDIHITAFVCFKTEMSKMMAWFRKKQQRMEQLQEFIEGAQPYITITKYKNKGLNIESTETIGL